MTKEELLKQTENLFLKYGIRSMTMDDIARAHKISKKTLYKFFNNKNELVIETMEISCKEEREFIEDLQSKKLNAVDESFEISRYVVNKLKSIHPSIHYDLEKYYPEAWKVFQDHIKGYIFDCISRNMKQGIEEDLYRNDIDIPVIARFYILRIDAVFDPELFPPQQFEYSKVYHELFRYHIRGIANKNGIEILEKKLKHIDNEN